MSMRRIFSSEVYWFELEIKPGWGPILGVESPLAVGSEVEAAMGDIDGEGQRLLHGLLAGEFPRARRRDLNFTIFQDLRKPAEEKDVHRRWRIVEESGRWGRKLW